MMAFLQNVEEEVIKKDAFSCKTDTDPRFGQDGAVDDVPESTPSKRHGE